MSFQLPFGVRVLNPVPVENKYFNTAGVPYTGTSQVLAQIPVGIRHIGLTVNVNNVEYWFETGTTNGSLVTKSPSIANAGGITGATNGLTKVGANATLGGTLTGDTTITIPTEKTLKFKFSTGQTYLDLYSEDGGSEYVDMYLRYLTDETSIFTRPGQLSVGVQDKTGGFKSETNLGLNVNSLTLRYGDTSGSTSINVQSNVSGLEGRMYFESNHPNSRGLEYKENYSSSFVARSLVDKGYVTGLTTTSGVQTANNGLTKNGTNVRLGGTLTGATTVTSPATGSRLSFAGFPVQYSGDYSANFNNRSLVDLGYAISGGSTPFNYDINSTVANTYAYKSNTTYKGQGQVVVTNGSAILSGISTIFLNSTNPTGVNFWRAVYVKDSANNWYRVNIGTPTTNTSAPITAVHSRSMIRSGTFNSSANVNVPLPATTYTGVTGTYDYYLGYMNWSDGNFSLAMGNGSYADNYSTAIGGSAVAVGASSFATGFGSLSSGANAIAMGSQSRATGNFAVAMGYRSQATGLYSIAFGINAFAQGESSFVIGRGFDAAGSASDRPVIASGLYSINISRNDASQTSGHGALADYSAVIGGLNNNIPSNSNFSVIIGGNNVKALSADTNTVYMPKVRIGQGTGGALTSGSTSNDVIVRGAGGILQTRTISSLVSGTTVQTANNGLTKNGTNVRLGGTLTGATTISSSSNHAFNFSNLGAFSANTIIGGITLNGGAGGVRIKTPADTNISGDNLFLTGTSSAGISSDYIYLTDVSGNNTIGIQAATSIDISSSDSTPVTINTDGTIHFEGVAGSDFLMNSDGTVVLQSADDMQLTVPNGFNLTLDQGDNQIYFNGITDNIVVQLGTGSTFIYDADYSANYTDRSLVDKQYVDNIAAGLDTKQAAHVATVSAVTGTYVPTGGVNGSGSFTGVSTTVVDGHVLTNGDRILVKNQADLKQNGVYVRTSSTVWTRSTDMDGTPAAEVSTGNYVFVTTGATQAASGWVVIGTGDTLTLNTDPIEWAQFSASISAYIGGDGIDITGATIDVDLAANSGLEFSTNQLRVASTIAGAGLAFNSGVISVNTGNGLSVVGDTVVLGGSLTGNTTITGGGTYDLELGTSGSRMNFVGINVDDGLTVDDSGGGGIMLRSTGTVELNSGIDVVRLVISDIDGGTLFHDTRTTPSGIEYNADYSADFTTRSLVDKGYVDGLVASSGVTVNNGLTKSGNNIYLGGTLTGNTMINGDGNQFQVSNASGVYLTAGEGPNPYVGLYLYTGATQQLFIESNDSNFAGAQYDNDYSANFVASSLVNKGFVDTMISTGITTASNGLTKTVNDIALGGSLVSNTIINATGSTSLTFNTDNSPFNLTGELKIGGSFGTLDVNSDDPSFGYSNLLVKANESSLYHEDPAGEYLSWIKAGQTGVELNSTYNYEDNVILYLDIPSINNPELRVETYDNANAVQNVEALKINKTGFTTTLRDSSDTEIVRFTINDGSTKYIDTRSTTTGIEYGADYSADFTPRSLVDKAYVTGLTTTSGVQTASNGLTKSGTNVRLGGTLTGNTFIDTDGFNFRISGVTASVVELTTNSGADGIVIDGTNTKIDIDTTDLNITLAGDTTITSTNLNVGPTSFSTNTNAGVESLTLDASGLVVSVDSGDETLTLDNTGLIVSVDNGALINTLTLDATGLVVGVDNTPQLTVNTTFGISINNASTGLDIEVDSGGELNTYSIKNTEIFSASGVTITASAGNTGLLLRGDSVPARLQSYSGTINNELKLTVSGSTFTDNQGDGGLKYAADYSADYSDRSLVDKAYVDLLIPEIYSTNITLTNTSKKLILCGNNTSGTTITLPASPVDGKCFHIKDRNGNALTYNITIAGNGNNIDGASSASINTDYGSLFIVYSSAEDEWYTLAFVS